MGEVEFRLLLQLARGVERVVFFFFVETYSSTYGRLYFTVRFYAQQPDGVAQRALGGSRVLSRETAGGGRNKLI